MRFLLSPCFSVWEENHQTEQSRTDTGKKELKPYLEQLLTPDGLNLLAWIVLLQRSQRICENDAKPDFTESNKSI